MKNPIIIVLIVVGILGIGVYTFSKNSSTSDSMMKKDSLNVPEQTEALEQGVMEKKEGAMMEKTDDKMMKSGSARYVEYSKAALDGAVNNRRVLFFYASWCPTCKPTDTDLTTNSSKIPVDVTVIRVNYNDPETDQEEKDLAKKYGITYQHTFVQIDGQGKEVTKWNGGKTEELLAKIK